MQIIFLLQGFYLKDVYNRKEKYLQIFLKNNKIKLAYIEKCH